AAAAEDAPDLVARHRKRFGSTLWLRVHRRGGLTRHVGAGGHVGDRRTGRGVGGYVLAGRRRTRLGRDGGEGGRVVRQGHQSPSFEYWEGDKPPCDNSDRTGRGSPSGRTVDCRNRRARLLGLYAICDSYYPVYYSLRALSQATPHLELAASAASSEIPCRYGRHRHAWLAGWG